MAELKILTKNYVSSDLDDITVSSGSSFKDRICDRDNDSIWASSGENSDLTESSVTVVFKAALLETQYSIDTVILINHNLKNPIIEYWDGSAWQTFDSETGLSDGSYTLFTHALVSTSRIRVRNSATLVANAEKFVGELIACASVFSPSADIADISQYNIAHRQKSFDLALADGQLHRTIVKHSPNRSDKYEASIHLDYLSSTDITTLKSLKQSGASFLVQPESSQRPTEIYWVNWTGGFSYSYVSTYKGAGFKLSMDVKEI